MLKTSSYKDLGQSNIINMYLEENAIDSLFGKSLSKAPVSLGVSIKGEKATQIWALSNAI